MNGPTGLIVGGGKGVIRSMHCNQHYPANVIPVDIAINDLIIIAKELAINHKHHTQPLIVNIVAEKVYDSFKRSYQNHNN